jgi:hypothetical protein
MSDVVSVSKEDVVGEEAKVVEVESANMKKLKVVGRPET